MSLVFSSRFHGGPCFFLACPNEKRRSMGVEDGLRYWGCDGDEFQREKYEALSYTKFALILFSKNGPWRYAV